jgi:hypothetical protein
MISAMPNINHNNASNVNSRDKFKNENRAIIPPITASIVLLLKVQMQK